MPSAEIVLDTATRSSWFGDVDSAEMFHNYTLSEKAEPYAGVGFSLAKKGKALRWERCTRMVVGLSSPFATTRIFAWVMEVIMGDRKYEVNLFYGDSVVQNCPVTNEYNPSIPSLYRWDSKHQVITATRNTFADDLSTVAATQKLSSYATHSIETVVVCLGLQDETRKQCPNFQSPGDWTGYMTLLLENAGLCVTVSKKKWVRAK